MYIVFFLRHDVYETIRVCYELLFEYYVICIVKYKGKDSY